MWKNPAVKGRAYKRCPGSVDKETPSFPRGNGFRAGIAPQRRT
jgi:hypothetical protein